MSEARQERCKDRIGAHLTNRISDLRKLWRAYCAGAEDVPDLGSLHEYGLAFDYVAAGTFKDQGAGYFRYQLSWGGPSDEFRFYTDAELRIERIEYWFLDWFDGAHRVLRGRRRELMAEIFGWFEEGGSCAELVRRAREE